MDLWIRSQDKEILTKIIDIYKQADTNEIWGYSDRGIKNCLGFYKSKERALEILDEIQNILEPLLIVKNCTNKEEKQKAGAMCNISDYIGTGNNCDIHLLSNNYVYQMPEE